MQLFFQRRLNLNICSSNQFIELNLICLIIVILIGTPVFLVFADSETEDELLNKANELFNQGKNIEAILEYDKILSLNPQHEVAKNNILESLSKLSYRNLDGYIEIIVRDSDGYLISYSKSTKIKILNDDFAEKYFDELIVSELVTRNGQDFDVLHIEGLQTIENELVIGNVRFMYDLTRPQIMLLQTFFPHILVDTGDTVNYFYTIFRPIE